MPGVAELASRLKLTYIRDNAEEILEAARKDKQGPELVMAELLAGEIERRSENTVQKRLPDAKFPIRKYLADFDRGKYASEFLPKFRELETLQFIDRKENVILIGTSGAGKTH